MARELKCLSKLTICFWTHGTSFRVHIHIFVKKKQIVQITSQDLFTNEGNSVYSYNYTGHVDATLWWNTIIMLPCSVTSLSDMSLQKIRFRISLVLKLSVTSHDCRHGQVVMLLQCVAPPQSRCLFRVHLALHMWLLYFSSWKHCNRRTTTGWQFNICCHQKRT